jgi:hypothetical protein
MRWETSFSPSRESLAPPRICELLVERMCAERLTGPVGTEGIAALAGEGVGEPGSEAGKTVITPAMDETVVTVEPVSAERAVTVRSDVAFKVSMGGTASTWMLISS